MDIEKIRRVKMTCSSRECIHNRKCKNSIYYLGEHNIMGDFETCDFDRCSSVSYNSDSYHEIKWCGAPDYKCFIED